jgi:hypothetical protein
MESTRILAVDIRSLSRSLERHHERVDWARLLGYFQRRVRPERAILYVPYVQEGELRRWTRIAQQTNYELVVTQWHPGDRYDHRWVTKDLKRLPRVLAITVVSSDSVVWDHCTWLHNRGSWVEIMSHRLDAPDREIPADVHHELSRITRRYVHSMHRRRLRLRRITLPEPELV